MNEKKKKAIIIIIKIISYIVLIILALAYAMKLGYFLHGFLRGGETFGVPYFIVFVLVLSYTMFTKKKIKYYLTGLLIIYSLAVIGFTEYMDYLSTGQATTSVWYKEMYKEGGIDIVYNWFVVGWAVANVIFLITAFNWLNKKISRSNMKINNAFFIIYVKDQDSSTNFYSSVFQREPDLDVPGMTEFHLSENCSLGIMPVSGIKKLLGKTLPDPSKAFGIPRAEIYLNLENPEYYLERALQFGAKLLSDFKERDWGDKAAYCLEPDGHVIAFAEKINTTA